MQQLLFLLLGIAVVVSGAVPKVGYTEKLDVYVKADVNGGWSAWSDWEECKVCSQLRRRTCTNPPPSYDGEPCTGSEVERSTCCDVFRCPVYFPEYRKNCGYAGITEQQCIDDGCCFDDSVADVAWCYFPTVAPPNWHTFGAWNYFVDDNSNLYWKDARQYCLDEGGDLAVINSPEENKFIWDLISAQPRNLTSYLGAWIGFFRQGADSGGELLWVDQTPVLYDRYQEWKDGNPDNAFGRENCGHIIEGKWNDLPCNVYGDATTAPVTLCQRPIRTNPVWYTFGEWNYYVDDTSTTHWEDARTVCQKNGGDLAIIRSAADNSFVTGLIKLQKTQWYGGWIGLFHKDDTKFYWVDGTPLQGHYSAWSDGEPSNSNGVENCTHILHYGRWNDLRCDSNDDLSRAPVIVCQRPIRFSRCPVNRPTSRTNCGYAGITEQQCIDKGCCFDDSVTQVAWCFFPTAAPSPVWHSHGNHKYYVDNTPTMNWGDARNVCQNVGGDLAIIKSSDETDFILNLLSNENAVTQLGAWIGLFRNESYNPSSQSKTYGLTWVDGTEYDDSYGPWANGQPDNYFQAENCVHMKGEGNWNDLPCNAHGEVLNAPVILCQKSK